MKRKHILDALDWNPPFTYEKEVYLEPGDYGYDTAPFEEALCNISDAYRVEISNGFPVRPKRWIHMPEDKPCACEFPSVWLSFPDECHHCMRLLPTSSNTKSDTAGQPCPRVGLPMAHEPE
jgi:hypothetical protein